MSVTPSRQQPSLGVLIAGYPASFAFSQALHSGVFGLRTDLLILMKLMISGNDTASWRISEIHRCSADILQ